MVRATAEVLQRGVFSPNGHPPPEDWSPPEPNGHAAQLLFPLEAMLPLPLTGVGNQEDEFPTPRNGSVKVSETRGVVVQFSYFVGEHSIPNNGHDPQAIRDMIEEKYRRIKPFVTKSEVGWGLAESKRDKVVAITNEIRVLSGVRGVMEIPPALGLRIRASLT